MLLPYLAQGMRIFVSLWFLFFLLDIKNLTCPHVYLGVWGGVGFIVEDLEALLFKLTLTISRMKCVLCVIG